MIAFQEISKSYGSHTLLDQVSFKINSKEKVGLVGRNGHGKTTIFRMILKEETPDGGTISLPKSYKIGTVRQNISFSLKDTVSEAALGLSIEERDETWQVEKILAGLGFGLAEMARPPQSLSGGFQVRLNLAKALLSKPDMLLLDEPNNYLDITSIRWLAQFLSNWPSELMLITHDRLFMDRIITHTLAIHRKKVRKVTGDTSKMYEQIALEEEIYEKTRVNEEKRRKEMELFITRFRAKARLAGMVQSRVKTLAKLEKKDQLNKIKEMDFSFTNAPFPAKYLFNADNLSFGYEKESVLFDHLTFSVGQNDRICVIGPNGRGKTTLLKILSGELKPHTGKISFHAASRLGYYEQTNATKLVNHRTVADEIQSANSGLDVQRVRNICGAMMFEGDDALKQIGLLSGGEKCRVVLGKILAMPVNLLLLDEPTNHLDLSSVDALLEALDDFDGGVIMVSHNEMLLYLLANKLIIFQEDNATFFDGTYQDFLDKIGWKDEVEGNRNKAKGSNKKEQRKQRGQMHAEKSRQLKPLQDEMVKAEEKIHQNEKRIIEISKEMERLSVSGGSQVGVLAKELAEKQKELELLLTKWEEVTLIYEEKKKELEEID